MLRKLLALALVFLFVFSSLLAEELEAVLVKYSAKDKTVTVKVKDKEETYKLFETAKFKQGKKTEVPASDFFAKAKQGTKMKLAIDSGYITEITTEKKGK